MRSSIRQVAERAGVSKSTVSNLLLGRNGRASPETRKRVLRAAAELNYIPVPQPATQTRHTATRIIGLMFDCLNLKSFEWLPAYQGLSEAAEQHGYDLLTLRHNRPPNWSREREEIHFLDRRCDAFIFIMPINRYGLMETLVRHGIPVVSGGLDEVPPGAGFVAGDNEGVMRQAVQHLVEHGHRRIGHLAGPSDLPFFKRRLVGFHAAMADAGLEPNRVCIVDETQNGDAARQMARLAAQGKISAVACANDTMALQLWEQAEALGLRVPRDLSIVGVDDTPEAAQRGLTSFRIAIEAMGHAAVDAAVAALDGAPPWRKLEAHEIVPRGSVATPRAKTGGP